MKMQKDYKKEQLTTIKNDKEDLFEQIKKQSFLCIGLDTDLQKFHRIFFILMTQSLSLISKSLMLLMILCVAYKPNIAFYESMRVTGWNNKKDLRIYS